MAATARCPLARLITLLLGAGFLGLLCDLRVEHVAVVHEAPLSWTPIIYSALMAVACLVAALLWNRLSRLVLRLLFLLAFVVGGAGFYLHNHGHIGNVLTLSVHAWTDPAMKHPRGPPPSAPLAFAALGLFGTLATLKRFNG
jgi:hypothetical protein